MAPASSDLAGPPGGGGRRPGPGVSLGGGPRRGATNPKGCPAFPRAEIRGATGTTSVDVVRVQSIEVGEAKAGPLVIVAHDIDAKDVDGLLGRDFLNHFNVNIDTAGGVVTLSPR